MKYIKHTRLHSALLAAGLLLCLLPLGTAAQPEAAGDCGDGLIWELEAGTLTVSGTGPMEDFEAAPPWQEYRDSIRRVALTGSVTTVGSHAFENYDMLEEVDFGSALHTLGVRSFADCDNLTELWLPDTFRVFGDECLRSCDRLKAIHSEGAFPSFKQSCLWETRTRIYYPASRPWPVELIVQLEEAFQGWIEFIDSEGHDPYQIGGIGPVEAPPETTAPPTEAPETTAPPETTEPPVTVPETTQAPPQPETQPTVPTESAPETEATYRQWTMATAAPTQPAAARPRTGANVGLAIVGLSLSLLGLGAIVFGRRR